MARPDDRPLRRLPQLAAKKDALEKCVFCPKLCRSACPVSNAEPRETITPWGKMSMAYFAANESVPIAPSFAAPAWACTGCFACREQCDHKNDVAGTLFLARGALAEAGVLPPAAARVLETFSDHAEMLRKKTAALRVSESIKSGAKTALLVGCAYASRAEAEAKDAIHATARLAAEPVDVVDVCCGAPLLYAGDRARFIAQGKLLAEAVKRADRLVVVDAGCAATLRIHHAAAGLSMPVPVELFVEHAARALMDLQPGHIGDGPARWHDPCQLGRGLGVYDAPRAVLARILGHAPDEFERRREGARCSGAGGLLPVTMPDVYQTIARERAAEHERAGGGTVVTGCASSLRAFREQGMHAIDIVTVVARALGVG